MKRTYPVASVGVLSMLLLTACGPSAEKVEALEQDNERACAQAMSAFNDSQDLINSDGTADDHEPLASQMADAGALANGDTQEVIADTADRYDTWIARGAESQGSTFLPFDLAMWNLEANCTDDESE
ncbi:hypothetical protein [Microbacterium murale]|uniref:Lipoprotein n=1 Tax=Microbacterium murale TaxID=1081040 RepID=A0ABU0PF54_9MICO|nr:hypothetical protein [Microbacterium murale]MDQ0645657.1 hypothetical protein [Microbacterium murale]